MSEESILIKVHSKAIEKIENRLIELEKQVHCTQLEIVKIKAGRLSTSAQSGQIKLSDLKDILKLGTAVLGLFLVAKGIIGIKTLTSIL